MCVANIINSFVNDCLLLHVCNTGKLCVVTDAGSVIYFFKIKHFEELLYHVILHWCLAIWRWNLLTKLIFVWQNGTLSDF